MSGDRHFRFWNFTAPSVLPVGLFAALAACMLAGVGMAQERPSAGENSKKPAGPLTGQILVGEDAGALQIRGFLKRRIPPLKLPPDRDRWSRESAALREKILEAVIFKGIPPAVREAGPIVLQGETLDTGHGYLIRKLAYEGYPGIWIPALLYLPKELKGKVPAILNPNGHEPAGKAVPYKQIRCINFAKRGMIALSYDWPGYGQLKRGGIDHRDDTNALVAHNNAAYLDLCGQSGVGVFYLIARRGLEVLLSLPNVDSRRVGMTGLSGGGWQTIILSALDERIRLAIPVAGYTDMLSRIENPSDTGDLEQNPPDLGLYADYSHLTALLAPRAALLIYNHNDFFNPRTTRPRIYEAAMPFYKLFGAGDCLRFHDSLKPGDHNYELDNRQQAYQFINEHFLPKEQGIDQELDCSGEILTEAQATMSLPGKNATWQELALKAAEDLPRTPLPAGQPTPAWANELRQKLKEVVRYPSLAATITELPGNPGQGTDAARRLLFTIGQDWRLPALELPAEKPCGTAVIVADGGKAAAAEVAGSLLHAGWQVVAVDLLLDGELTAPNWPSCQVAHMFETVGQRLLGIRAAQLEAVCQALAKLRPGQPIKIVGVGAEASLAALVAGCFSDTAQTLVLIKLPASLKGLFAQGVYQMDAPSLFCPGLLELAEIGHLKALAGRERVGSSLDGLKSPGVQTLPAPAVVTR